MKPIVRKRKMRHVGLSVFALLCASLAGAAGEGAGEGADGSPLRITGFGLDRLRKDISGASNRVTATFTLEAAEGADFRDLRARVEYTDVAGTEVARAGPSRIGDLDGGKRKSAYVSSLMVPIFNGYIIELTGSLNGRRGKWSFFGASAVDEPAYLPPRPVPKTVQLVYMAHELLQDLRSPRANLYVRVRNLGAVRARGAKCTVEVFGKGRRRLGKATTTLSGARGGRPGIVDGGEERLFVVPFRRFPTYETYFVGLEWEDPSLEELLSGGEFGGAAEVELGHFAFRKPRAGRVEISGEVRNGLDRPVENVRLMLRLLKKPKVDEKKKNKKQQAAAGLVKEIRHVLPGRLEPGGTAPFTVAAEKLGDFDDFEYEVGYDEPGAEVARTAGAQPVISITKAVRKPDDSVELSGSIKSPGGQPICDVQIEFSFKRVGDGREEVVKKVTHFMPGVLPEGEGVEFEVLVPDCPAFDEYFYEVKFAPAGGAG